MKDPINDARRVLLRDPGFAAWILVSELLLPLPRAIRWCRKHRAIRQQAQACAQARSLAVLMRRAA